jgi:hypothetical protein
MSLIRDEDEQLVVVGILIGVVLMLGLIFLVGWMEGHIRIL